MHWYIDSMGPAVSDEVWRQLHPGAGRLSRRQAARAWIVIVMAFAVVTAGIAVGKSGLVTPQLEWALWGVKSTAPPTDTITMDVEITNRGLAPVTIIRVGRSGPGLALIATQGQLPVRLAATKSARISLVFRITDCEQSPTGSWPVTVEVHQAWRNQTAAPRPFGDDDFPWQRAVTDRWCHPTR
jgi:hypothetical protein